MMYWLKQLGLVLVVVVLAVIILILHEEYTTRPLPEGAPQERSIQRGLSDFYREYRNTFNELTLEKMSDFVLDVQVSSTPLEQRLEKISLGAKPVENNWVGTYKNRSFRPGSSLREAMTEFAKQDGVRLVWDLNQDFVVKHPFQMEGVITDALAKMSKSIDANFEQEVVAYLCPKARALVITTEQSDALMQQCQRLRSR
jgi:hypothetical protein